MSDRAARPRPVCILLDINGTLGHKAGAAIPECPTTPVKLTRHKFLYCRPGCVPFVQALANHPNCYVGVFTCWQPHNAQAAVQALGIQSPLFYTYAQVTDPRLNWCEADKDRWSEEKNMYEWKKNLAAVLPHVSKELGCKMTLGDVIMVDDTLEKVRDFARNVIVAPTYDAELVKRNADGFLPALQRYLLALLGERPADVRAYLERRPFSMEPPEPVDALSRLVGGITLAACPPTRPFVDPRDRRGESGKTVHTFHGSQFKLFYSLVEASDPAQLDHHLKALVRLRRGRFPSGWPEVRTAETAIRLWTKETTVAYQPKKGDCFVGQEEKVPFYKFLNHELRCDSHDTMPHVAYIARVFNCLLAKPFRPRRRTAYRGTTVPAPRIAEFFSAQNLAPSGNAFRFPTFLAASYQRRVAGAFCQTPGEGNAHVLYEIHLPETMAHARDIHDCSEFPEEAEVLFPPYSVFTWVRLSEQGGVRHVEIEAAPDNRADEKMPCPMWH